MTNEADEFIGGWRALTLRSDAATLTMFPDKGADIYSFIDHRTGVDVLLKSPSGLREPGPWLRSQTSIERWMESYSGGWQVLLPNGGDECVEYGVNWNYHGEAALLPWTVQERDDSSVTLEVRLMSLPLHVRRTVSLRGGVLRLEETVTNESPEDLEFMWSHHPAFGAPFIEADCILSSGFRTLVADDQSPGTFLEPESTHDWPLVTTTSGDALDLSRVPGPDEPRAVLAYFTNMRAPFYAITNPRLNLGVGLRWSGDVFDKAWLWQEVHSGTGWPWFKRCYAIAVEPASTIPGHGMTHARSKGHRGVQLNGFASKQITIEAVLFEGSGVVANIHEGGAVDVG
ncbi:MAG TPA: aldose 1-epimerase [Acidimicrobiales bacterium]